MHCTSRNLRLLMWVSYYDVVNLICEYACVVCLLLDDMCTMTMLGDYTFVILLPLYLMIYMCDMCDLCLQLF